MKQSQEGKIISEFLNSVGPWSSLSTNSTCAHPKLENAPVGTRDIDTLIPRRIPEISKKNIAKHLHETGFTHVFKDLDVPATEAYVKEIDGLEVEIEFLTDSATLSDKNKNVVIGGIVAQPLSYLTLSLQMTTEFQTYSGETG